MSIKNAISNNGINSATFNGKNYTRREVNGVVFYDITSSSSGATSGGGASVNVSDDAPSDASQGDLWYDSTTGSLYIWMAGSTNAWIQTNGGSSSGASLSTGSTAPDNPGDGDLWFDESVSELYAYIESQSAWIQTNGGGSGGGSGPRAYVSFDGTAADLTASITNSFNVASITDIAAGYYHVDFTSPILNPVATLAAGQTANGYRVQGESFKYFASTSDTISYGTPQVGGSIARIFVGFGDNTTYVEAKPISLVVH